MFWVSEIAGELAGKAENFLNKIDQKTANVLNLSNDVISNKINDENEFVISNISLANSQSLPQLKSIFVSSDPESEFKHGHSRESSTASYHGLTMKDSNFNDKNNKFISKTNHKPIDDGQLFDYLNNKQKDYNLTNYLAVEKGDQERSSNESLRQDTRSLKHETNFKESIKSTNHQATNNQLTLKSTNESNLKQSEAIKNVLMEEKQKLNDLKVEYKKHTENLNNEINFLKDQLNQHLIQKNLQSEVVNLKQELKLEKENKEKFEKEVSVLYLSFNSLKSEFEEYKVRAQRTLHSKDNLIEKLKQQQNLTADNSLINIKFEDFQNLEKNNQQLLQDLQEIEFKYSELKQQTNEFTNERINELENQLKHNQHELNNVRTLKDQFENELNSLKIQFKQNENKFSRLIEKQQIDVDNKQQEIEKLNKEFMDFKEQKWAQQSIPQDLELKIKNLTENLLNKQSLVEHLKREKNSLTLELEESKRQLCNLQNKNSNFYIDGLSERNLNSPEISLNDSSLIKNSSYNTPVARRVRKAYSQVDQFSHQIGCFIRAYPLAQKILLIYIILLHLLVFFILFSSKPEA